MAATAIADPTANTTTPAIAGVYEAHNVRVVPGRVSQTARSGVYTALRLRAKAPPRPGAVREKGKDMRSCARRLLRLGLVVLVSASFGLHGAPTASAAPGTVLRDLAVPNCPTNGVSGLAAGKSSLFLTAGSCGRGFQYAKNDARVRDEAREIPAPGDQRVLRPAEHPGDGPVGQLDGRPRHPVQLPAHEAGVDDVLLGRHDAVRSHVGARLLLQRDHRKGQRSRS
jgi:hypothetical protein